MREPRGHAEMYGAILVRETELTASGEADIGVLFCHNGGRVHVDLVSNAYRCMTEGYSTMCGHATIALGRFLVDTHDLAVFPRRNALKYDSETGETLLRLHAPCGVVHVRVPTIVGGADAIGSGAEYWQNAYADGTRAVSFTSVRCFLRAIDFRVDVPAAVRWPELHQRDHIVADIAFGGAYYALVPGAALGFTDGLRHVNLGALGQAAATVKALLAGRTELYAGHDSGAEALGYLYGVIVTEELAGERRELGVCFFADGQVDRSPTGSGVCARLAAGVAKGVRRVGESVTYESLVSLDVPGSAFVGVASMAPSAIASPSMPVVVTVGGRGMYTGVHAFVVESGLDPLAQGFLLD